jgi:hypothetical protein
MPIPMPTLTPPAWAGDHERANRAKTTLARIMLFFIARPPKTCPCGIDPRTIYIDRDGTKTVGREKAQFWAAESATKGALLWQVSSYLENLPMPSRDGREGER